MYFIAAEILSFFCEIAEMKLKVETYNIRKSVCKATKSHALDIINHTKIGNDQSKMYKRMKWNEMKSAMI